MYQTDPLLSLLVSVIPLLFLLWLLYKTFFITKQQTLNVIERFGRFSRLAHPGLGLKIPFIDRIVASMNMRTMQINIRVETKTRDDVFVQVPVSVQFKVLGGKDEHGVSNAYKAHYALDIPEEQIKSYVYDVIRSQTPGKTLDELFAQKDEISENVKEALDVEMKQFGWDIVKTLITDIEPAENVKEAMNRKEASKRLREAAENEGEAERIKAVKAAEAEKESKRLQGEGLAAQRRAIAIGLKHSVDILQAIPGTTGQEVLMQLLITQHFDTLSSLADKGNSKVIFVPSGPGAVGAAMQDIMQAISVLPDTKDNEA